ncbi:MAG TPA: ABC transporter permease [Candidatus Angelobacter sp.]|jgi:ABC-type antimicrobial peptide transport system permease subunit
MSFHDERQKREQDLDEEIGSHLRMAEQDRIDRGVNPDEAYYAARREIGNVTLIKEVTRGIWGGNWMSALFQDLRYGLRVLRRSPGFTLIAVFTLALGISATTAIFSVVYGVLLRPLPYDRPDQLVQVWEKSSKGHEMNLADLNFQDFRADNRSLQGLAEFSSGVASVSGGSEPKRLTVASVSSDFFPIMRVSPIRGRGFAPEEQRSGAGAVALVSYSYWQQYLNSTDDLSSVRLRAENRSASVVGVLPPGFRFPDDSDVWMPRELAPFLPARSAHNWEAVARLRDGITIVQARDDLSSIAGAIKKQYGEDVDMTGAIIVPLQDALTSSVRGSLLLLLGAVGLLLLVACANVMNLLLAQAAARETELAIRNALGASRTRMVRQFMAETLLLSLTGGVVGVIAAYWGVHWLLRMAPPEIPGLAGVSVNLPVLLFALGLSLAVAVGLGTFTALRSTSTDIRTTLAEGGKGSAGSFSTQFIGRSIVVMQLAITMTLVIGAGLLGRSLMRVLSVNPGFRTEHVVTLDLALPSAFTPEQKIQRVQFLNDLFMRLTTLPGVEEVGGTNALPLSTGISSWGGFAVVNPQQISPRTQDLINRSARGDIREDSPLMKDLSDFFTQLFRSQQGSSADYASVSEGYFRSLGIPLVRGRLFDDRDTMDAPHVALISESLAREKWPNEDPTGHTIEFGNMDGDLRLLTVIGVVGDVRESSLEKPPRPTIYVNYRQRPQSTYHFSAVVRTAGDPASVIASARKIVRDLDPDVPPNTSSFTTIFAASTSARRFNLLLFGIFAGTALLLAIAGIYGVLAYSVARRTREMGVRMALGATAANVMRLILGQAAVTTGIGIALGLLGSFILMRSLQSMLYEVGAADPLTFAAVALLLLIVALLAAYLPARRATRVDPNVALRYE